MKQIFKKKKYIWITIASFLICFFFFTETSFAANDEQIKRVLLENYDIFRYNTIFSSAIRWIGWSIISGLAFIGAACAELFDKAFLFVDFTQNPQVAQYIEMFDSVFIALICLSLVALGLILIFWHEKKPKFAMNLLIAILIVSSGSEILYQMNRFLAEDVRGELLGQSTNNSSDMVYEMVGSSVYDLQQLDRDIGLMNVTQANRRTLPRLTEKEVKMIDINEIVKPDDVQDASKDLMGKRIDLYVGNNGQNSTLIDIYNGVAWTDLLNEYYYRYNVNWILCILGMLSVIIVYLCMAYKVIRILYEIVIHYIMVILYSANLSNSQKTIKILEGIKDSYITLLLVMICVKVFNMAYYFINNLSVGGITKAFFLLFVAFAVADGPNIVQKITGIDAGLSSAFGKVFAISQGARAVKESIHAVGKGASHLGNYVKKGFNSMQEKGAGASAAANFEPTDGYKNKDSSQGDVGSGRDSLNPGNGNSEMPNAHVPGENATDMKDAVFGAGTGAVVGAAASQMANSIKQGDNSKGDTITGGTSNTKSEFTQASSDGKEDTGFKDASGYNAEKDSNTPYQNISESESERDIGNELNDNGLSGKSGYDQLDEMEQELSNAFNPMDSELGKGEMPSYDGDMLDSNKHLGNMDFSEHDVSNQAFEPEQPIERNLSFESKSPIDRKEHFHQEPFKESIGNEARRNEISSKESPGKKNHLQ